MCLNIPENQARTHKQLYAYLTAGKSTPNARSAQIHRVAQSFPKEWFNVAAFAQPIYSYGDSPRGIERNPPYQTADMSLFKNIPVYERCSIQLRLEAFNAFNLITLGNVNGSFTNNKNFGTITSIGDTPRQLQLGAKVYF